jgi:hypothetical protein
MRDPEYFYVELESPDAPGTWVPVGYETNTREPAEKLYGGLHAAGLHVRLTRHGPMTIRHYQDRKTASPAVPLPPAPASTGESLKIFQETLRDHRIELPDPGDLKDRLEQEMGKLPYDVHAQPRGGAINTATVPGAVQMNDDTGGFTERVAAQAGLPVTDRVNVTDASGRVQHAPGLQEPVKPLPVLPAAINPDTTGPMMKINPAEMTQLDMAPPAAVEKYLAGNLHPGDPGYVQAARTAMTVRRDPHQGTRVARQMG